MAVKPEVTQKDLDFAAWALSNTNEKKTPIAKQPSEISEEEREMAKGSLELPKPEKEISRTRSLLSAVPKGFYRIAGGALGGGPMFEQTLEEVFPTQKGQFAEGALQGATELAAGGAARNVPGVLRSLLAGVLGESVEQAPFIPEKAKPYVKTGAELFGLGIPGFSERIQPKPAQAELVEKARGYGMSEKEIAPLIQGEKKVDFLSKISGKRFRTQKVLEKSKQSLDAVANKMLEHPDAKKVLSPNVSDKFLGDIQKKMYEKLNANQRNAIKEDFQDLINSPRAAEDFINFYRDIGKQPEGKQVYLSLLKDDIRNAIKTISPELGSTFETTNKLYSNYYRIAEKLKPSYWSELAQLGRGIVAGLVFGHYPSLVEVVGEVAAKNIAREMLINPRFQNLSMQMTQALNSNKLPITMKLWERMTDLVRKTDKKTALEMEKVDWSSLPLAENPAVKDEDKNR